MADRITEVLEDGTVYCFDMDKCTEVADKIMDDLLEREGEIDFDYTAVVFSLFINSIHILRNNGWSTEELIGEVVEHSEIDDQD